MLCRHDEIKIDMKTGVKYCLQCGKEFVEDAPEKQCPVCKKTISINKIHSCIEHQRT